LQVGDRWIYYRKNLPLRVRKWLDYVQHNAKGLLTGKRCDNCGIMIRVPRARHVNVMQPTPLHVFCSKECKMKWVFKEMKKE